MKNVQSIPTDSEYNSVLAVVHKTSTELHTLPVRILCHPTALLILSTLEHLPSISRTYQAPSISGPLSSLSAWNILPLALTLASFCSSFISQFKRVNKRVVGKYLVLNKLDWGTMVHLRKRMSERTPRTLGCVRCFGALYWTGYQ